MCYEKRTFTFSEQNPRRYLTFPVTCVDTGMITDPGGIFTPFCLYPGILTKRIFVK
jgi:hypothetical protein